MTHPEQYTDYMNRQPMYTPYDDDAIRIGNDWNKRKSDKVNTFRKPKRKVDLSSVIIIGAAIAIMLILAYCCENDIRVESIFVKGGGE